MKKWKVRVYCGGSVEVEAETDVDAKKAVEEMTGIDIEWDDSFRVVDMWEAEK